ncbi:MAG: SDR family NAD(P)-dependent oxidoreductase [Lacipirellulaceae bacterium]
MPHNDTAHLILGAGGGVGAEVSRRLVAAGARVLLAGRTKDKLAALAAELGAEYLTLDATDFDAIDAAAAQVVEAFGRLDGIVNCAGSLLLKSAATTSLDEYRATIDANLTTAFAAVRAAGRTMRKPGPAGVQGGSVVLVSSAAGRIGLANHEAIAAAKAGVIGLALSAAATLAPAAIRVNAVAPGLVRTPLTERIWSNAESASASLEMHAAPRLGEAADVAAAICWLLDTDTSWVTGQVIGVDGGLATVKPAPRRR